MAQFPSGYTFPIINSPVANTSYSGLFNSTSTNLQFPGTTFQLSGQNTFTVECFMYLTGYFNSYAGGYNGALFATTSTTLGNGGNFGLQLLINGTASSFTGIQLYLNAGTVNITGTYNFSLNTWYHIALVRNIGGVFTIYVNGVSVATTTNTTTWIDNSPYSIGYSPQTSYNNYFNGYISNFRITNTAVYTSNFTPPTSALTAIPGTLLLTCQDSTPIDHGQYNLPITNTNVTFSQVSPPLSTVSSTVVDMADMFVRKELFLNAGLWIWGYNNLGQLGNGTIVYYSSPIQVGSLTNWKQVAANYHTASIKTDGTLWTFGYNNYGQLGNGTIVYYSSPIQVGSLTNWKQVSAGYIHTASIKTDGTLWTFGYNNYGQLGNGTTVNYSSPIQIGSLTNWKQVSSGGYHTTSIKTDGTLWTCGYNGSGGLGNGTTSGYSSPIQVGSLTNWKQVAGGLYHTASISSPDLPA